MLRSFAKQAHTITNATFWLENPDWNSGNSVIELGRRALSALPFSLHALTKHLLFDTKRVIAVNGESVVALNGPDKVDKFMFRYPRDVGFDIFLNNTSHEVNALVRHLAGIALPTEVSAKTADIFRLPIKLAAVAQTQRKLDLAEHGALNLQTVMEERKSPLNDRTARDLEILVTGADRLAREFGFYPDIAHSSGNVRRSMTNGQVTLLDVMPIYADGRRLIGDHTFTPPQSWPEFTEYRNFVGQYGG